MGNFVKSENIEMKAKTLDRLLTTTCVFGVLVSTYTLYVEMAVEIQPGFKAFCDISEHASCSKVLTSKYAKGFGVIHNDSSLQLPNCIYGIIFYCTMIFMTTFDNLFVVRLQFLLSILSIFMCIYLAYLLAFVLYDFCIVCVSTYIVNGVLMSLIYKKMGVLSQKIK